METTVQEITSRRSTKKFTNETVPQNLIDKIIAAGLNAPSALNHQGTIIICIKDKRIRDELSKDNAIIGKREGDPFYGAPIVLLVLGDKSWPHRVYDGSLVIGNMLNAAHALGLGACWVHRCREEFEMDKYKELLKKLDLTDEYEGIGHCIIGYPATKITTDHITKPNRIYYL